MITGGNTRPLDVRDYDLGAATLPLTTPDSYMVGFDQAIYNQLLIPACGAHAGAFLKGRLGANGIPSPRYTWEDIKTFDGFPATDGTDMRSIFKSLQNGVLGVDVVPNETTLPLGTYTAPTDLTETHRLIAGQDIIENYAFHDNATYNDIKNYIYQYGAVLLLIRVGNTFWEPSYAEKDLMPLRNPTSELSDHFVVAMGYDENYIYFANSFGVSWARNGFGYFDATYMPNILEVGSAISHEKAVLASQKLGLLSSSLLAVGDSDSQMIQQLANIFKKIGQ